MDVEKKKKIIKEVKSITLIVVIVFTFRSIFFEPFRIPSGSMIPTLMIGDFILVNKFSYGFKVPFSDISIFGINSDPIYLFGKSDPKRGDVVVFKYPEDPSINYIKRVVGIPGDEIEIVDKKVYVNDKPMDIKEISGIEIMKDMDEKFKDFSFEFFEVSVEDTKYTMQQSLYTHGRDNMERFRVPQDHFFVMGDNRDFSLDSRYWGFVPHKYIRGKAILVWFSMIFPFGELSFKFRPYRIGTLIK